MAEITPATPRASASPGPRAHAAPPPSPPCRRRRRAALSLAAVAAAALVALAASALAHPTARSGGDPPPAIISPDALAAAVGAGGSGPLWLAFLGDVYSVGTSPRGRSIYAPPDGPYAHFAGRDGTVAFVSGDFSEAGVTADLPPGALQDADTVASLAHWARFYESHADYRRVGVTPGPWYDAAGRKTAARVAVDEAIKGVVDAESG